MPKARLVTSVGFELQNFPYLDLESFGPERLPDSERQERKFEHNFEEPQHYLQWAPQHGLHFSRLTEELLLVLGHPPECCQVSTAGTACWNASKVLARCSEPTMLRVGPLQTKHLSQF